MRREVLALLRKELWIEWKQKYAFNGLILYVAAMVVVISLAFGEVLDPLTWNVLFWLMLLFAAINAVAKSFLSERKGHFRYLYALAHPTSVMVAKLIYNVLLLLVISMLTMGLFLLIANVPVGDGPALFGMAALGSAALAANLTLVAAIAAKAENRNTLLAVLSFPVIIPVLLLLIDLSKEAMAPTGLGLDLDALWFLLGITAALAILSVLLFPFVWRD